MVADEIPSRKHASRFRPRPGHRRLLLLIGACLSAGALINFPVAWWCLSRTPDWRVEAWAIPQSADEEQAIVRSIVPGYDASVDSANVFVWEFLGLRDFDIRLLIAGSKRCSVQAHDAGWPFLGLRCVKRFGTGQVEPRGIRLTKSVKIESFAAGIEWREFKNLRVGQIHYLPIQPRWVGFSANTAVYTTCLLILLVGAPRAARRTRVWIRARRGQCVRCAYDLGGNTTGICPECGRAATL